MSIDDTDLSQAAFEQMMSDNFDDDDDDDNSDDDDSPPSSPLNSSLQINAELSEPFTEMMQSALNEDDSHDAFHSQTWKNERNTKLIREMLSLSDPRITDTMRGFLTSEGVTEILMAFIVNTGEARRPQIKDETTEEQKRSYRACMLLAPDSPPSPFLEQYLDESVDTIIRELLKSFSLDSSANLHHVCRIFSVLLQRHKTGERILHIIGRNHEAVHRCIEPMLNCLEHRQVSDLVINLVSFEEVEITSPTVRFKFVQALSQFKLFDKLCRIVSCVESSATVSSAVADVIIELIGKVSDFMGWGVSKTPP
tara:strand:+ start:37 stop:966 length:930 start_codon:yes stop_codon:yes gene_type:complete